jgi:hypothetical protein
MTFRWMFSFFVVLSVVASLTSSASAAQFVFSTVGPPVLSDPLDPDSNYVAPGTVSLTTRPELTLNAGQTGELHVWIKPNNSPPAQSFLSAAIDIDSSNAAIAHATGFDTFNPVIRNQDPITRWNGTNNETIGAVGATKWIENAAGARVTNPGIGNNANTFLDDPGRDTGVPTNSGSRAFYFGKLTFQAEPGVVGTQQTGLYMRVGSTKTILTGGVAAPVEFGPAPNTTYQGNVVGAGDPMTDLLQADALITVVGGIGDPCALTLTPHTGTDTASGDVRLINAANGDFRTANNLTQGRVNIVNAPSQANGNLTVYFDLVNNASAQAVVDCLNALPDPGNTFQAALAPYQGTNRDTNLPVTSDISVTFVGRGFAGSDQFIDFNFGPNGAVAAVGVPEPSSFGIAGLGLIGLVGLIRKRRRAA